MTSHSKCCEINEAAEELNQETDCDKEATRRWIANRTSIEIVLKKAQMELRRRRKRERAC